MTKSEIAAMVDHTNLNPCATGADIRKLCGEADAHKFASVCVNPSFVALAAKLLADSDVKVCTVVGFPLGAETADEKAACAASAIEDGADEIDMVVNLGLVKEGDWAGVGRDIAAVVDTCREADTDDHRVLVKVILETCFLTDAEIVACCREAEAAGADFVKTSTGFAAPKGADGKPLPNGATVHAVELMRLATGGRLGVKASGGIRTFADAVSMVAAGATRLGTSAGTAICGD